MRVTGRQILLVFLGAVLATGLALAVVFLVLSSDWASRRAQQEIVRILEARLDASVHIDQVTFKLVPRLVIDGRGLTLTRTRDESRVPFVRIDRFHASGSPLRLLRRSIARVEVEGFQIDVARGRKPAVTPNGRFAHRDLQIDEIRATRGLLRIVPDNPEKLPREFELQTVEFFDFSFDHAGRYTAQLTNPTPAGVIWSSGSFGPWNTLAPRSTPLSGEYSFTNARLETIKGIGGVLSSIGSFQGVLEHINVTGTTSTPDFQLDLARQPINLDTRFRAIVDGTSGDTHLEDVDATLGESHIVARGSVVAVPRVKGRTISLEVEADGRFEDFLRLAVKAPRPPMHGHIDLKTTFVLPPGDLDVPRRMQLKGRFRIRRGQFSSDTVQDKIDELSRRGRGEPQNQNVSNVVADFGGDFALQNGRLHLPMFQFSVEGARVALGGDYGLPSQRLAFEGDLILDAPLSKTTTGFKSVLLKLVDPLFRKRGAGTVLPISVTGTVDDPSFSLDKRRALLGN